MTVVVAALIGLIGVVVGAVAAGTISELREARREQALVRGVMRVLELDLLELRSQIRWSLDDGRARFSDADARRITRTWFDSRDLLARHLRTEDEWVLIAKTFQMMPVWGERSGDRLAECDRAILDSWLASAEAAEGVLRAWQQRTGADARPSGA